ncbi:MAG: hypothetical protein FIB08_08170 [Candidatus Methanoperedens sp.]|nr:hypothetical protein [Candidatus Methanoperedens sp.]
MEFDVDKHVKSYWNRFIGLTGIKFTLSKKVKRSIREELCLRLWSEGKPRTSSTIQGPKNYTRTENHLNTHSDEAIELGFNIDQNGNVIENEPDFRKDASLEDMMQYLVKKGIHEPVAMYFRNPYVQKYEECPDAVLDVYHYRKSFFSSLFDIRG